MKVCQSLTHVEEDCKFHVVPVLSIIESVIRQRRYKYVKT